MLSHRTKESESLYSSGTDNHAEGDSPYRLSFAGPRKVPAEIISLISSTEVQPLKCNSGRSLWFLMQTATGPSAGGLANYPLAFWGRMFFKVGSDPKGRIETRGERRHIPSPFSSAWGHSSWAYTLTSKRPKTGQKILDSRVSRLLKWDLPTRVEVHLRRQRTDRHRMS